jgi:hypothetical protein
VTTKHQSTHEEGAYGQLLEDVWEKLSGPAQDILDRAQYTAYADNLAYNYAFHPEEYEEAMAKMRLAKLTDQDRKLLAEVWISALAAAESLDPDDYETPVGYRTFRGDLHWYYRVVSDMVRDILSEQNRGREPSMRGGPA